MNSKVKVEVEKLKNGAGSNESNHWNKLNICIARRVSLLRPREISLGSNIYVPESRGGPSLRTRDITGALISPIIDRRINELARELAPSK
jgi:hypothetical protein